MSNQCFVFPHIFALHECDEKCSLAAHCTVKEGRQKVKHECKHCGYEFVTYEEYQVVRCPVCLIAIE